MPEFRGNWGWGYSVQVIVRNQVICRIWRNKENKEEMPGIMDKKRP